MALESRAGASAQELVGRDGGSGPRCGVGSCVKDVAKGAMRCIGCAGLEGWAR